MCTRRRDGEHTPTLPLVGSRGHFGRAKVEVKICNLDFIGLLFEGHF
jgi:hypothetical protein